MKLRKWFAVNVTEVCDKASTLNRAIAIAETTRTKEGEREAARLIARHVVGLGPKQARNILQLLGLTRYEIPLDSRFSQWLQGRSLNLPIPGSALSDEGFYEFVLDAVQDLCERANVLPCISDAAVFAQADPRGWTDEQIPEFLREV